MLREHGETNEQWAMITRYLLLMEKHEDMAGTAEHQERFGALIQAANDWHEFRTLWFWDDNCEIVEEE